MVSSWQQTGCRPQMRFFGVGGGICSRSWVRLRRWGLRYQDRRTFEWTWRRKDRGRWDPYVCRHRVCCWTRLSLSIIHSFIVSLASGLPQGSATFPRAGYYGLSPVPRRRRLLDRQRTATRGGGPAGRAAFSSSPLGPPARTRNGPVAPSHGEWEDLVARYRGPGSAGRRRGEACAEGSGQSRPSPGRPR